MKKNYLPWFLPQTGSREQALVKRVISSNYLNDGNYTRLFEKEIARLIGVKHCVGVTSGTAAISLSLMGLGVGKGDEVLVPDLTFIATANAARLTGATVKLIDVEPVRFSIDVDKAAAAISSRTKAIIPVDVNGRAADYTRLEQLAKKRGLCLICDSTEGLGSKYKGRFLGTFGDAGCFSFSANKTVTTGQGGMIATNNTALYHRLLELKDQGRRSQGTGGNDLHPVMGYNFKLTNLQSAVGLAQLERLNLRLLQVKKRDRWYQEELSGLPGMTLPSLENKAGEVCQWADILFDERKTMEQALNKANIGFRPFWHPLHRQKPYAAKDSGFINSLDISRRGLWLPSCFDLEYKQVKYVCKVIRQALEKQAE